MNAGQIERLGEQMQRLRLFKTRERPEAFLPEATSKELSYTDFLDPLLTEEVSSLASTSIRRYVDWDIRDPQSPARPQSS